MSEANLSVDECVAKVQEFLNEVKDIGYYNSSPKIRVRCNEIGYDRAARSAYSVDFFVHMEIRNNGGFSLCGKGKPLEDAFNRCAEQLAAVRLREQYLEAIRAAKQLRADNRELMNGIFRGVSAKERA
jgi:hypothetical protein